MTHPSRAWARCRGGTRERVLVVGLIVFLVGVISGPASGFTFVYGEGVLKIRPDVVASVVALSALTGLAGLLLSRYLSGQVGRRWTIVIGVVVTAITASIAYGGGRDAFIAGYMSGVLAGGLLAPAICRLEYGTPFRTPFEQQPRVGSSWPVYWGAISGLLFFGLIADAVHVRVAPVRCDCRRC